MEVEDGLHLGAWFALRGSVGMFLHHTSIKPRVISDFVALAIS